MAKVLVCGSRVFVSDFVEGTRVRDLVFRETETDALAHAMFLERRGMGEQADEYLESYLRAHAGSTRH